MTVKLVLVDDHDGMRRSLVRFLETVDDFSVVGDSADPAEGLETCQLLSPDVVLVDIRMKEMNGYEFTRRLRSQGSTIGVVGISALPAEEATEQMQLAGADGYVEKVSDPITFIHAVRMAAAAAHQRSLS